MIHCEKRIERGLEVPIRVKFGLHEAGFFYEEQNSKFFKIEVPHIECRGFKTEKRSFVSILGIPNDSI